MSSQQVPPGHDRLNGWKEIAAFLGKGVRTAQRWEREFGLPVRRIGHEGGEIVYAFRHEIDRWSRAAERGRGLSDGNDHPEDRPTGEGRPAAGHTRSTPQAGVAPPEGSAVSGSGSVSDVGEPRDRARSFAAVMVLGVVLGLLAYAAVNVAVRWLGALRP
jgi:hypothetical protein